MSVQIGIVRRGTEGSTESQMDGGVLAVVSTVSSVVALQPSHENMLEMMVNCLSAEYQSAEASSTKVHYKWVYCREEFPQYKYICCESTSISVDDGDPEPVMVKLVIDTSVP